MEYIGAIDLGATKVTTVIADIDGNIVIRLKEPIQTEGGEFTPWRDGFGYYKIAEQLVSMLYRAISDSAVSEIKVIGIGSAGPLSDGAIINSTNIKLPRLVTTYTTAPLYIPLVDPLSAEFNCRVALENDCTTAILGEVYYGAGKDVKDKHSLHLVYVTLSTGFGAGVWNGHLLRGKEGNAAEIGHFFVKEDGLRCGCGNYGCAEAYVSGRGMEKNARMRMINERLGCQTDYGATLRSLALAAAASEGLEKEVDQYPWQILNFITPPLIFAAAHAGDRLAQGVIDDLCHYGGIALANIANAYDPQIITFGGSIMLNQPQLLAPIYAEMVNHINVRAPKVILTPLGEHVVEYGAIALARQLLESDQLAME
ncbi:ROK family protein [Candidatus Acetothermia bacterium]|jgi:glucokinase|nr:ROK family protein [Candidatus Acetothermia bacterium]MCI2426920.1 ROK family protein [Candidatus Acetothermia bacterium]MCI2428875.1 ROK family protein [Candidatus Acetothermia bacterium]